MRRIERTKAFKRDYKRVIATPKHRDLDNLLPAILTLLETDTALPAKYVDHPLRGEWKDYRDCHVKPDLVLIYRKTSDQVLQLVRLGSHSALGVLKIDRRHPAKTGHTQSLNDRVKAGVRRLIIFTPIVMPIQRLAESRGGVVGG